MSRGRLLDIAMSIAMAEEIGRELSKAVSLGLQKPRPRKEIPRFFMTRSVRLPNTVLYVEGEGVVRELVLVSPSPSLSIEILVEGERLLHAPYRDLEEMSSYVGWVSAFASGGRYIASLRDIEFTRSVEARARPIDTDNLVLDLVAARVVLYVYE